MYFLKSKRFSKDDGLRILATLWGDFDGQSLARRVVETVLSQSCETSMAFYKPKLL